jgi:hypothetical protein
MRRLLLIGAAAAAAAAAGFYYRVRPWWKSWGHDPAEADLALPGDDLVAGPSYVDTRGITIDAPPSQVWPWLVQMGYERGGWYSYDQMDMKGKSAETIVPEWQSIEVGDTLPAHPGGGFAVKVVEPEQALVLYLDDEIARGWQPQAGPPSEAPTRGLAFTGAMGGQSMPGRFAVSWAFALRPGENGTTRLLERFRARIDDQTPGSRLMEPAMGFGIFVMQQRQMLGIKERAEKHASGGVPVMASEAIGSAAEPVESAPTAEESSPSEAPA